MYRDRATVSGEYEFCFDNSFSHISTKTVFFHITVTEEATATTDTDGTDEAQELLPFEITVENFRVHSFGYYFYPEICAWLSIIYNCMKHLSCSVKN